MSEHEQDETPHTEARAGLASAVSAVRPEPEPVPDEGSPNKDGEG